MTKITQQWMTGVIVDENMIISFVEICEITYTAPDLVKEMVGLGLLEPTTGVDFTDWQFSGKAVLKLQIARRLQRDFDMNLESAALALDLIDEVKELRQKVTQLERLLLLGE